ncbi:BC_2427 family protein [Bacillus sp. Brlt_9]|uniref:BC_2427 family protein n=1 Tax=Bacillus sp. Brlt_9 TaxID=3110916 RepID=UPI003F7B81ED
MNKPWIGKGLWDMIYKDKKMNMQDDLQERRGKREEVPPELKEEEATLKLEKEEISFELKAEDTAPKLEKEEVPSELKKEIPELEKEKVISELKGEDTAPELEEEEVPSELKGEDTASKLEKEEVPPELKGEDAASKLEKEGKASGPQIGPLVRSMVLKTPFSIFSEVSSFKIFPKINVKNQEVFVFQNEKDVGGREVDSKLLTTVQQYHSDTYCKLVSLNLHEKRVHFELYNQNLKRNNEENKVETSSWIPIHSIILESENGEEVNNFITAKLPIEIGRYKGEISLREKVIFKEKVIGIKEVEQEIVLTKTKFLVPKVKKNGQNTFTVEKGSLLVEGYINQCIEYISEQSTFHDNVHQLIQNIVLELIIQVIQEQEVQVKIK